MEGLKVLLLENNSVGARVAHKPFLGGEKGESESQVLAGLTQFLKECL